MVKGIRASGERIRKKFSIGKKACLVYRYWPSHKPNGMPGTAGITKPIVTLRMELITLLSNRPASTITGKKNRSALLPFSGEL